MTIPDTADASRRSLLGASALGACVGLAIGGAYLAGGLARAAQSDAAARQVARAHAAATRLAEAAAPTPDLSAGRLVAGPVVAPFILRAAAQPVRDIECLSQAVYYEARGEAREGRQAVAQVVLNRVRHPRFPKSICGVVFQHATSGCAFSFACDGQTRHPLETAAWQDARRIAQAALTGFVMHQVGAATDFRGGAGGAPSGFMRVAQIGGHVFYRFTGRGGEAGALTARPQLSTGAERASAPVLEKAVVLTPTSAGQPPAAPAPAALKAGSQPAKGEAAATVQPAA